jgi:D-beta-D-heptose 7-phosphate kinase/D-beta-D-heptose 1-phosphate adenosyltransferase
LKAQQVGYRGVTSVPGFITATKTRIVAQKQQVTRLDRESNREVPPAVIQRLLRRIESELDSADAVTIGDYAKGVVTQVLVDGLRERCRARGLWLSFDPKPSHPLNLRGLSLLTPNRKEAFELARISDTEHRTNPLADGPLLQVAERLLQQLAPALLLITLGEFGMLLCQRGHEPFHVPTVAQDVFDVSGAGDTVIASFTLAIAAGASPIEASIFSNHAAGVVVGKVGTATASPEELLASFANHS